MYQIPCSLKQIHLGRKEERKTGRKEWKEDEGKKENTCFLSPKQNLRKKVGESSIFIYTFTKAVPKF